MGGQIDAFCVVLLLFFDILKILVSGQFGATWTEPILCIFAISKKLTKPV